ncbi:MAG: hypothetical protein B6U78_02710 [Candidatus Aenigmarchaeota archaeon ex4484_224]|nr:MAG: hypothetical protein B6U78_02710 [Candidatus Aenigmarchaeota archaeon ex4484_224]
MKKLFFAKEYKKKLEGGKKKMTIRKGYPKFKEGQEVEIYAGNEKIGNAKITKIKVKKFSEITNDEIIKDGFKSKTKLKKALRKHYKTVKANDIFTLIEFEFKSKNKSKEEK